MMWNIFKRRTRPNKNKQRGSVLAEAAIIMPFLLTIIIGAVETGRYVNIHQKLDRAAVTLSDLVARSTTLTEAQIQDIFFATAAIMSPYQMATSGRAYISSVTKSPGQAPRVTWQRTGGGSLAASSHIGTSGGNATLPSGFTLQDNESVIIAEVMYTYNPIFVSDDFLPTQFYERALFRPRTVSNVTIN